MPVYKTGNDEHEFAHFLQGFIFSLRQPCLLSIFLALGKAVAKTNKQNGSIGETMGKWKKDNRGNTFRRKQEIIDDRILNKNMHRHLEIQRTLKFSPLQCRINKLKFFVSFTPTMLHLKRFCSPILYSLDPLWLSFIMPESTHHVFLFLKQEIKERLKRVKRLPGKRCRL